jgi:methionine synthase II (cobalamin-independent)
MSNIKTNCIATAIGSFPHSHAGKALDIIFDSLKDAPLWPQLPKLGLNEQMEIQYSEGMPCAVIDRDKSRMFFDTSGDYSESFAGFYESYMLAMDPGEGDGDCSAMAISPDFSQGLYGFEERLMAKGAKHPFIKVQTTGPCSFALTITDENKRAIYYNEEFRDVIVKALAMKCRWQINKFKRFADRVICFIDEPILSAFGSSTYISVKRDEVVALINEVAEAVHAEKAIAGVHCCGNTDWSILIDAGIDLINFDAFSYGETVTLYPDAMKNFLGSGGLIAWGIVPTSSAIREQTVEGLLARLDTLVENLAAKTAIDKGLILEQSLVTPSCGTGSLSEFDAEMVFTMLNKLSAHARDTFQLNGNS